MVFGISLLLVVGVLSYLTYRSLSVEVVPPNLQITLGSPIQDHGRYSVPVTVYNQGGETAEEVLIEVVLGQTENPVERAEITFPYVPKNSEQKGFVTFTTDPRRVGHVESHVMGYLIP